MKLGKRGFLSGSVGIWTDSKRRRLKKWFRLIEGLNRAAMRVLAVEPDSQKKKELCAALLYRLTYANVVLRDKYLSEALSPEEIGNLRKLVAAINSKYANGRPKSINWADAAIL
jgi:hypothetical protein